jgi:hypothetical protein
MERRNNYYVSRKNALTWLSAALMFASAMARIAVFWGRGPVSAAVMWFQILLPVAASVIFVLNVLLDGERHFYRTAVPAWIFAICFAQFAATILASKRIVALLWVLYLALAVLYTRVSAGRTKHFWLLWFVTGLLAAFFLYEKWPMILSRPGFHGWMLILHNLLMALSFFAISLALQVRLDNAYYPTWGDRSDGRRLCTLEPITSIAIYIMPSRNGANNEITDTIDLTPIERYVRIKRAEGLSGFGITHVFLAAYVRTVAQYPAINRFCSGQHLFARDRNIEFNMAVKTKMTLEDPDTMIKVHFDPADTAKDVYDKLNREIEAVKDGPMDTSFDNTAKALTFVPGVVLKFTIWLLKLLDYFGLLHPFLLGVSPFHGSVIFTSMGSLGIPPVVHHLYDFGNLPVFLALGCKRRENVLQPDGTVVEKKFADFTVNCDERICDGFYFASALRYMRKFFAHPERLDTPPDEVVRDID